MCPCPTMWFTAPHAGLPMDDLRSQLRAALWEAWGPADDEFDMDKALDGVMGVLENVAVEHARLNGLVADQASRLDKLTLDRETLRRQLSEARSGPLGV